MKKFLLAIFLAAPLCAQPLPSFTFSFGTCSQTMPYLGLVNNPSAWAYSENHAFGLIQWGVDDMNTISGAAARSMSVSVTLVPGCTLWRSVVRDAFQFGSTVRSTPGALKWVVETGYMLQNDHPNPGGGYPNCPPICGPAHGQIMVWRSDGGLHRVGEVYSALWAPLAPPQIWLDGDFLYVAERFNGTFSKVDLTLVTLGDNNNQNPQAIVATGLATHPNGPPQQADVQGFRYHVQPIGNTNTFAATRYT